MKLGGDPNVPFERDRSPIGMGSIVRLKYSTGPDWLVVDVEDGRMVVGALRDVTGKVVEQLLSIEFLLKRKVY